MRASSSALDMVLKPRRGSPVVHNPALVEIRPHSLPWSSVAGFSTRLGVTPATLLEVIGISERTAARRKAEGFLKPEEADRLLRVARVYEEAIRAFGDEGMAAGWLSEPHALLYGVTPLSLLDSDAGAQEVSAELGRIKYGEYIA